MARAGEHQRVDHPAHADRRAAAALKLVIEEAEIEAGIVRDQRRIADEFEQFLGLSANSGLSDRKMSLSPCTASASLGIGRSGLK